MRDLFKQYRHLASLVMVVLFAVGLANLNLIQPVTAFFIVVCWQLAAFARSPQVGACFMAAVTEGQIGDAVKVIDDFKAYAGLLKGIPDRVKGLEKENDELRGQLKSLRKIGLRGMGDGVRWIGNKAFVSDDCAAALTSVFVLSCSRLENGLESLIADASARERIKAHAAGILSMEVRTAMTGTEIPLPTVYTPQIIELVFKYGQARQYATVFPLGAGTVKLPRLKAGEDDFGYFGAGTAGMSQPITEKRVTAELVTFTANKAGGLIRIPYELEEDTFIPIGQFLARYIARQLAKLEDKTLFLADGTSTYASQTGVGPYCATAVGGQYPYLLQLAGTKTKPSDATLNDYRNLRGKVSPAILAGGSFDAAYYINPTFEPVLRGFNSYPNFVVYDTSNPGKPTFDGWPVRWVGVIQAYSAAAAASTFIAFFGDLSFWFLGERGTPRVEVSREVFFATDELAMRALERIDVEAMGIDAMAALQTAAA
jgi:HK97 family phage major capsid protein